jgi:hypothetical protein
MQTHQHHTPGGTGAAVTPEPAGRIIAAGLWRRAILVATLLLLGWLALPQAGGAHAPSAPVGHPPSGAPLSPTPTPCSLYFTDVPGSSPFYGPIVYLACQSVLSGYQDATFRPGLNITRGQTAKLVANSAGFADPIPSTQQTFADVLPADPFWLYVERTALHGAISGYQCGISPGEPCDPQQRPYFRPGLNVTRGQLAKIVVNAAAFADPIPSTQQTFADVPYGSPFWIYAERAALHNVLSGYQCGVSPGEPCDPQQRPYFRAGNAATRGQTSKINANTFFPGFTAPPALPMLRLGRGQDPGTLLPYTDFTTVGAQFRGMVFNSLVRRDQTEQVGPDLANTVPTFATGGAVYTGSGNTQRLVVTYHLKTGVHWYDGIEFTSADVL